MHFTPNRILNRWLIALAFFTLTRPKLFQIVQTRHQSTPLFLYSQNIKLVCNSGLLFAGLYRTKSSLHTRYNLSSVAVAKVRMKVTTLVRAVTTGPVSPVSTGPLFL